MSNDYFDPSLYQVTPGTTARAADINVVVDAISAGFDKIADEPDLKRNLINYGLDTGLSANAYIVTLSYGPTVYSDGMEVVFKARKANTGASSLNVNAIGVLAITRKNGEALAADDILEDKIYSVRYNSSSGYFEMQGSEAGAGAATVAVTISSTEPSSPIAGMLWVDTA